MSFLPKKEPFAHFKYLLPLFNESKNGLIRQPCSFFPSLVHGSCFLHSEGACTGLNADFGTCCMGPLELEMKTSSRTCPSRLMRMLSGIRDLSWEEVMPLKVMGAPPFHWRCSARFHSLGTPKANKGLEKKGKYG